MLQITLLGNPTATVDGRPPAGGLLNKDLALLYYLAVSGQPQPRASLAVLLWGDHSEAAARVNLRKSLSGLRQSLGDHLLIERDQAALVRSQSTVDMWEFERLAKNGLAASDSAQLQAAAALYRGDFLAGFSVRHAPDYDRWVYNLQEQLRSLAVQVLTALASQYAAAGELAPAIAAQRQVLALEPWREESHRDLMLLLARSGERSAALAQYKHCVLVMAEELGVPPSAMTSALAEQIRAAVQPAPVQAASQPPPRPATHTYSNLPPELAPLVGRADELNELSAMLHDPDCRTVTILGIGGIGKTRLALALAHQMRADFGHVAMVSLADTTRSEEILPMMARSLGIASIGGEDAILAALANDNPYLLLVLDNFEHLLPTGVEVLERLLHHVPHLRCVITSREALSTRWEWRYPLAELRFPTESAEDDPAGYSSVQLFLRLARRARSQRPIDGDELQEVMRICRLVGGMPLGIELAAAQVGSLPCAAIAGQIAAGVERLGVDFRDLPARQRSLLASFEASWATLSPPEQNALARLSVINGEFTLEAALGVAQTAAGNIMRLVDKSLLRSRGGYYGMHEVIRQQAAHRLESTPGAPAAAWIRYSGYYTTWVEHNLGRFIAPSAWEQADSDELENHIHHLWHLWLNSTDPPLRSELAVALMEAEHTYRANAATGSVKLNTWRNLEAFIEGYLQATPTYSGVLVIDGVWLPAIAERLADMTEEFAAHVGSLLPAVVDACRVDDRLLALPKDAGAALLYYRTDLLRKYNFAAPPATWEELQQMAAVIQSGERAAGRRDFWGFLWPGHKPEGLTCTALEWQHSEGGGCIVERDGRISVANQHAAAALARAARWVGAISPPNFDELSEWEIMREWANGGAAFMRMWSLFPISGHAPLGHNGG